jgi:arylformamidase
VDSEHIQPQERVYLNYTQAELDNQYDQRVLVPDISGYIQRWTDGTLAAKRDLPCIEDISYADHKDQTLDLYGDTTKAAPLLVYLHGGAWKALTKAESGYGAPAFVKKGIAFAALNFSTIPNATIDEMVGQVRQAIAFLYSESERFNFDRDQIHLVGHSSGAHMASMIAVTDWSQEFDLPADVIKSLIAVSGGYDLEPQRLSARNDYLKLDPEAAFRNTPNHHVAHFQGSAIIAWGEGEHDEYARQGQALQTAFEQNGNSNVAMPTKDRNHFDMASEFADPDSPLFAAAISQIFP